MSFLSLMQTTLHKKMKFSIKNFLVNETNPHETAGLVTFPEEILNGKLHYMCSESAINMINLLLIIVFTTAYQFTLLI